MAIAAAVLPFLPLLAGQILLINLLTDFPATFIATDSVDAAQLRRPQDWNVKLIRNYMIVFGGLSSAFDLVTFAITAKTAATVLRTRRPFFRSRPSRWIVMASILVTVVACYIPYSPVAPALHLIGISAPLFGSVLLITLGYVVANELTKRVFWRPSQRTA